MRALTSHPLLQRLNSYVIDSPKIYTFSNLWDFRILKRKFSNTTSQKTDDSEQESSQNNQGNLHNQGNVHNPNPNPEPSSNPDNRISDQRAALVRRADSIERLKREQEDRITKNFNLIRAITSRISFMQQKIIDTWEEERLSLHLAEWDLTREGRERITTAVLALNQIDETTSRARRRMSLDSEIINTMVQNSLATDNLIIDRFNRVNNRQITSIGMEHSRLKEERQDLMEATQRLIGKFNTTTDHKMVVESDILAFDRAVQANNNSGSLVQDFADPNLTQPSYLDPED